jgi:DNA-binding transcriptional regulator YdaS (Cro superfamily)
VQDVRASTLRRAAEILGSEEHLAVHLGITPSHLSLWLKGLGHAPDAVFLRAVDIVMESDRKKATPERLV